MPTMKVIFCDIDGVLNSKSYGVIEDDKLIRLVNLLKETNSKLYITSLWSVYNRKKLIDLEYSLLLMGVDYLGHLDNTYLLKDDGIAKELKTMEDVENYIIIDDDEYEFEKMFPGHFMLTNTKKGLTQDIYNICVNKLNDVTTLNK